MNSRLKKFYTLKTHTVIGKLFNKLTRDDIIFCDKLLRETESLDNNEFAHKVNRLGIDGEKRKNINNIWALLIQSI